MYLRCKKPAYYFVVLQICLYVLIRSNVKNDSSTISCSSHGVDTPELTEFDSAGTVQRYLSPCHCDILQCSNENSNEISIPPMKLEHLALVLYTLFIIKNIRNKKYKLT